MSVHVSLPLSACSSVCIEAYLPLCVLLMLVVKVPQYLHMALVFTRLSPSVTAYSPASRQAYLHLFDYMDVSIRDLNASHVEPQYLLMARVFIVSLLLCM